MEIQFLDLISRKERKKDITYKVVTEPFYFEGDYIKPLSEVDVNPIDIDIEERFTNNSEHCKDENVVFVKGDALDITEIVENSIISTLPIKRLCSKNCKGLCQSCGANLNKEACNCNNEDVDLRLAGLKALLDNKEV